MKKLFEKTLNRYLALDPESSKRLHILRNKIVTIELLGINLKLQMIFHSDKIELQWDNFLNPDLTIRGTPLNLFHLKLARKDRHQFFEEDVTVEGDMELATQVLAIFDELEIDWEEYISRWVGDIPAYQSGRVLRSLKKSTYRILNRFSDYLNEYIHEEVNLVPSNEALKEFFHEIDLLRMDVDRLDARIKNLEAAS